MAECKTLTGSVMKGLNAFNKT